MQFGAAFWAQRTDWPSLRDAAIAAEAAGFDSIWIDDHLLCDEGAWDDPKLEGWAVLSAIAAVTSRARLGLLVAANTLRNPGLTAKLATTLDHISGGRAILGLGAGWFEREHEAFGIPFDRSMGERLDRLAEAVELLRRLLDGEHVTHEGRFYRLVDAVCRPRPVQQHLPILVGGAGPRKTLPLIARLADGWNTHLGPEGFAERDALLRERCAEAGRDPESIHRTVTMDVVVRDTPAEADAAYAAILARHDPQPGEQLLDAGGPPEAIAATVARYAAVGVDECLLVLRSPWDGRTIAALPEIRAALAAITPGSSAGR